MHWPQLPVNQAEERLAQVRELMARFPDLAGRVQMLWHASYWDGPLSGYVEVDGEPGYWVECIQDWWNPRPQKVDEDDECQDEDGSWSCEDCPGDGTCTMTEWDRVYLVYKLDEDQHAAELHNHALFRKCVGTHTDYDGQPKEDHNPPGEKAQIPLGPGVRPRSFWKEFYHSTRRRKKPPLREDQVIGHTLELFIEYRSRR